MNKTNMKVTGDENQNPNFSSRPPFVKQVLHRQDCKVSAEPSAVLDEECTKKQDIYSIITNKKKNYLLMSNDEAIVADTMGRLRQLLVVYEQVYRTFAFRLDAPLAIANAMNRHPGSGMIQEHGCAILVDMLSSEDNALDRIIVDISGLIVQHEESTWAKSIVDAGCIEAVMAAMKSHPDKVNIQRDGCTFLCALAYKSRQATTIDDDYRKRIIRAKGLSAIGEARRIHEDNAKVVSVSETALYAILPQEKRQPTTQK